MQSTALRIGTRGSPLALAQADETRSRLANVAGIDAAAIAIEAIRTTGDAITDRPLAEAGGKGLFTKEIDEALVAGRIDIGVHSAKDLATRLPDGIAIAACLPRVDVRDVFISTVAGSLEALPEGAILGTSSLRRKALALRARPDLTVVDLRGNVDTRLAKIERGEAHATVLAAAGLIRLGLLGRASGFLDATTWIPAPGQGAIAITARADDTVTRHRLAHLDHRPTSQALAAERAYLSLLDGSCRTPIGGLALIDGDRISFRGIIIKPDGSVAHETLRYGDAADGEAIARAAAEELAGLGGPVFFSG